MHGAISLSTTFGQLLLAQQKDSLAGDRDPAENVAAPGAMCCPDCKRHRFSPTGSRVGFPRVLGIIALKTEGIPSAASRPNLRTAAPRSLHAFRTHTSGRVAAAAARAGRTDGYSRQ